MWLCWLCHRWVTEHPAEARRVGWIVSVAGDPGVVPLLWRRRVWMVADDVGGLCEVFVPVSVVEGSP